MAISVRKIALLAGCSPSTVSRVLSGNFGNVRVAQKTQDKIRAICEELNYVPDVNASRLYSKQTKVIGLLSQVDPRGLSDPNFSRFMAAVYDVLTRKGYRLQFFLLDEDFLDSQEAIALFKRREVDGLILWGINEPTDWLTELRLSGCPFVLAGNRCNSHPSVTCADELGMAAMVKMCLERGADSFVYFDGPDVEVAVRRREAFLAAATGHACTVIPCHNFEAELARTKAAEILESGVGAAICVSDMVAIGLLAGLREAGAGAPTDLLVAGADNIPAAAFAAPALTTYDQMAAHCGTTCAQKLLAHLETGETITSEVIAPPIIRRDSL